MRQAVHRVRISSKGQIVLPAALRRELGWSTGRLLQATPAPGGGITLTAADEEWEAIQDARRRIHEWEGATGRDLVEELHQRRRREREQDAHERERETRKRAQARRP